MLVNTFNILLKTGKSIMNKRFNIIWLLLGLSFLPSLVHCSDNYTYTSPDSLDGFLQGTAFQTLVRSRPHTGALYKAMLPANLSGMEVSIVRLRSRRLWNIGANFSHFRIPPRTRTTPHVKRLAVVYQDLGNWSSHYYSVPGYKLITPVVGFMVFNASNERARDVNKIRLDTMGKSIEIGFSDSTFLREVIKGARCVAFSANGMVQFSELNRPNVCYSQDQGHFSIVVPLERRGEGSKRLWYLWVIGFFLGFAGLALVGYLVAASTKLLNTKKIQVMERQADEDLVLQNLWVGSSKMPSASVTRTQPTLENGVYP